MHSFEGAGIIQPFHRVSANPACPGLPNLLWTFNEALETGRGRTCPLGPEEGSVPLPGKVCWQGCAEEWWGWGALPRSSHLSMKWLCRVSHKWERTQVSYWRLRASENNGNIESLCVPSGQSTNVHIKTRKPGLRRLTSMRT